MNPELAVQGAFDERFNIIISEHFRDDPLCTVEC